MQNMSHVWILRWRLFPRSSDFLSAFDLLCGKIYMHMTGRDESAVRQPGASGMICRASVFLS